MTRATRRPTQAPRPTGRLRALITMLAAVFLAACAADGDTGSTDDASSAAASSAALELLASAPSPYATGDDIWQVWVCHIPMTVGHPVFADDTWRSDRTAEDLVEILDSGIGEWFATISHAVYRPVFRIGGRVTIAPDDDASLCVDEAIARAGAGTEGALVVADARHRPNVSGGWGRPGMCATPCRATTADISGRAIYVGAADFGPAWGARPPLDLIQHELGHTLDLPHSGIGPTGEGYTSPIDLMSDSAAPRQVHPDRRDAPDTIGANRVALGWLPITDVVVIPADGAVVDLAPSTASTGTRLAVIPLDDVRLITVELLVPTGANEHLPAAGIAVHLIDQSPGACENPTAPLCTQQYRRQVALSDDGPHPRVPLLGQGDVLDVGPFDIRVVALEAETSRVAIEPD